MSFAFSLTAVEKAYLLDLARWSIVTKLRGKDGPAPEPPTDTLRQELGAFVTLKARGELRGCIGSVAGCGPLYRTVADMARCAAFEDPRFAPVSLDEYEELELEISILSPITPCPDPMLVEVGRHGLMIRKGGRSGLLLPQVPLEWGWDREAFLRGVCRKAGLPSDACADPTASLSWFEAVVFG